MVLWTNGLYRTTENRDRNAPADFYYRGIQQYSEDVIMDEINEVPFGEIDEVDCAVKSKKIIVCVLFKESIGKATSHCNFPIWYDLTRSYLVLVMTDNNEMYELQKRELLWTFLHWCVIQVLFG